MIISIESNFALNIEVRRWTQMGPVSWFNEQMSCEL